MTATIPPEREGEFLAAFRELSQADKPEGLQRSELLRATDGRWVIQSLWRDREAIAEARIGAFVHGVCAAPISISLSRELSGEHLAAFTLTVDVGDGRRIIENVSVEHVDGKIMTQVDVEAWD